LIQISQPPVTVSDENQLAALRVRANNLLEQLAVADDQKMVDWLQQRLGRLEQRDTAMLHRLLHDIEKKLAE
ncbi:tRNA/rRNA methyltransferase, partial [Pseudomonas aeruginosa]